MKRKEKILVITFIIFILVFAAAYTVSNNKKSKSMGEAGVENPYSFGPRIGSMLDPKIQLLGSDGKNQLVGDFQGKGLLINFWASWCGPCLVEMPALYKIQKKFENRGFQILAINLDDDIKDGISILEKRFHKAPFPVFQGMKSDILKIFPIDGVPYTVLVDKGGKIQFSQTGEVHWLQKENLEKIERIL